MITYQQRLGDVAVQDSGITLVASRGKEVYHITYVGVRVGDTPTVLPTANLSQAEALAVAQAHPMAKMLAQWRTPELVYIYDDDGKGNAPSTLTWRCVGESSDPYDSRTFHVNAVAGGIVRHYSNGVNYDIRGTVTAWLTPGTLPDPWGYLGYPLTGTFPCPNSVESGRALPYVLVEALNTSTGAIISFAYTDSDGDFVVPIQSGLTVNLKFSLITPYWEVRDRRVGSLPGVLADSEMLLGVSSSATLGSPVVFNTPDSQPPSVPPDALDALRTAHVNAHYHLWQTRSYYVMRLDTDSTPGLYDNVRLITNDPSMTGNAHTDVPNNAIRFGSWNAGSTPPNLSVPSTAYSTWVSHEYAHYVLTLARSILAGAPGQTSFHEGYADAVALYVQADAAGPRTAWGEDFVGCGMPLREPLDPRLSYPLCSEYGSLPAAYEVGEILSGIWLDLFTELEHTYGTATALSLAQNLQVDWSMVTDGGESDSIACSPHSPDIGRSAHLGTLLEVLQVDAGGAELGDAPHLAEICRAFCAHGIGAANEYCAALCGTDAPSVRSVGDCDRDGAVNVSDIACFQRLFAGGQAEADCDRDGVLTHRDHLCFILHLQRRMRQ